MPNQILQIRPRVAPLVHLPRDQKADRRLVKQFEIVIEACRHESESDQMVPSTTVTNVNNHSFRVRSSGRPTLSLYSSALMVLLVGVMGSGSRIREIASMIPVV